METLRAIIDDVAHLLPEQAPLHAFVHHNPLHAFEHLPFERAVVEAAEILGREPYQREEAFAEHLANGRILDSDLEAVVEADIAAGDAAWTEVCGQSRRDFILGRLHHLFEVPRGAALTWLLSETPALARLHPRVEERRRRLLLRQARTRPGPLSPAALEAHLVAELWQSLETVVPRVVEAAVGPRPRDRIRLEFGVDTDAWVHPRLIRLCGAFLDQGIAYWPMPGRERGFLSAFRRLYGRRGGPPDLWMTGVANECRRQEQAGWSPEETILWALAEFEIAPTDQPRVVRETLLSLRGWAGMMRQFEVHPERAPVAAHPARLIDYLAVQLTLDVFATRHARRSIGDTRPSTGTPRRHDLSLVYEAFVAAQVLPIDLNALADPAAARDWLSAVHEVDSLERRRLLHLAFERRYRIGVLDGLLAHERMGRQRPRAPEFQAVFCIDEREESLRRHLEETCPGAETFGYAGFFGVAMAYQGLDDIRPRPLCPVALQPRHLVRERAIEVDDETTYRSARRRRGVVRHAAAVGSRSLARGGVLTAVAGLASVVPLVARCLFPRLAEHWAHRLHHGAGHGPPTRLEVERDESQTPEGGDSLLPGYSVAEMAVVVETVLRAVGIATACSPLVLVVGHGSSSLNNPHEAAHDCGATGGGRGGPNARAFAVMANHPEVRRLLRRRGVTIPEGAWFVGAYHNTCDDAVTYYDEDLVPAGWRARLEEARQFLDIARALDAHERCRRFGTSPPDLEIDEALARAEAHSVDLAQPRPEYGHATNAVCIVGRRARTRGLYLDRRAFLVSYDPGGDPSGEVLAQILLAVGPVGAGINLEYYFSFVDPTGYGCGTKLPHNITGLIGVMDGHASDLRTGLPWQMVEIHEPVRLLLVVEAEPETLEAVLRAHPGLDRLARNEWIHLVSWSPSSPAMHLFTRGRFESYRPETGAIPTRERSTDFYSGHRDHLGLAHLTGALAEASA